MLTFWVWNISARPSQSLNYLWLKYIVFMDWPQQLFQIVTAFLLVSYGKNCSNCPKLNYRWVNQCLETFLRCFIHACPHRWSQWLGLAKYWYNRSFHSTLRRSPFKFSMGIFLVTPASILEIHILSLTSLPGCLNDNWWLIWFDNICCVPKIASADLRR